jgi:hypothetical protein
VECPFIRLFTQSEGVLCEDAFDDTGDYTNAADTLFCKIGAVLAPDDAPPVRAPK